MLLQTGPVFLQNVEESCLSGRCIYAWRQQISGRYWEVANKEKDLNRGNLTQGIDFTDNKRAERGFSGGASGEENQPANAGHVRDAGSSPR